MGRKLLAALTVMVLVGVACSNDDSGGGGDGGGGTPSAGADLGSLKIVWTTEANSYIPQSKGPIELGPEFGLNQSPDDISEFEAHATAIQVLLSGKADVLAGGFVDFPLLQQQGQDVKVFCPVQGDVSEILVGVNGVTDLEQVKDPDTRVGVDSPGGLINFVMNSVFRAQNLGVTVDDLENVKILEDGSLRLAGLASGEIDVGSVDPFERDELEKQIGASNVNVLSITAADADIFGNAYGATAEWLDSHQAEAAALCASVLKANRELASDFDLFVEWANKYIEPDEDRNVLKVNWDLAREYEIWPYNLGLLTPEVVEENIQVAISSGILEPDAANLSFDQIVDTRPGQAALEMVGGEIDPSEVTG
jgi:hypothetical protein